MDTTLKSLIRNYVWFALLALVVSTSAFGDEDWDSDLPPNAGKVIHVGRGPRGEDEGVIRIWKRSRPEAPTETAIAPQATASFPPSGYAIRPDPVFHLR
jgi:hypothetical protein